MIIFVIFFSFSIGENAELGGLRSKFAFSIKPELFFDSNVYETRFNRESDYGKQLWLHAKYDYKRGRHSGKLRWTGLLNSYNSSFSDNRFANTFQWQIYKKISKSFILGNLFMYQNKAWFNSGIVHRNFHNSVLLYRGKTVLTVTAGMFIYSDFEDHDTKYLSIYISRKVPFCNKSMVFYELEFSRYIIGKDPRIYPLFHAHSTPKLLWMNSLKPGMGMQFKGRVKIKIKAFCDFRRSESRLYRSYTPSLDVNLNSGIGGFLFACNLIYQRKYYVGIGDGQEVITPDPEETTISGFILIAEYAFTSFSSFSVKWINIRGETIYRGIFYSKSILTAGIHFRL